MVRVTLRHWQSLWRTPSWRRRTWHVCAIMLVVVVAEMSRGLIVPTLSPTVLAVGGTPTDVALAVALFSAGRLITTLPLGLWADKRGAREVLVATATLAALGNLLYSLVTLCGPSALPVLQFSRFLIGGSTATLGVCRGYLAAVSSTEDRTRMMSWSAMLQFVGFSLAPGIGGFMGPDSSMPGLVMFVINMVVVVLLAFAFRPDTDFTEPTLQDILRIELWKNSGGGSGGQRRSSPTASIAAAASTESDTRHLIAAAQEEQEEDLQPAEESSSSENLQLEPIVNAELEQLELEDKGGDQQQQLQLQPATSKNDLKLLYSGFALFFLLNLVLRGIIADAETSGPATQQLLNFGDDDAIEDSGIYFLVLGILGCVVFLLIDPLVRWGVREDALLSVGILSAAIGGVFLVDIVHEGSMAVFTIGTVLVWSIASPICQTLTISTFSKLLGSKPQASWMSWLTAAGSLGRILFPMLSAVLPEIVTFGVNFGFCVLCEVLLLAYVVYARHLRLHQSISHRVLAP